jgi:heptosyltransferase-2
MEAENVPYELTGVKRLVVLSPNWLGDAVMALPALADVQRALPGATIDVAARSSIAGLFSLVSGLGRVVVLERRPLGVPGLELQDRGYDSALVFPNSMNAALTAWRAGIPERWGYRTQWRGPLLTRSASRPGRVHQAAYYQHLTASFGFARGPLEPRLTIGERVRDAGAGLLASAGWDRRTPLVALAPGAAYGSAKRWPAERFAELAVQLARDGYQSVIIGSHGDSSAAAEVAARAPAVDVVGRTDIPTLAGLLTHCRGLVSNDSGAMHLGAAVGLKVTALFGPTDDGATRPLGRQRATVLTHPVWCRPCMLRECPIDHRCMRRIEVDRVAAAVGAGS